MKIFDLAKHGTNVKTEFVAGFTTFLTMMYIVPVNGFILADAGMPMAAVVSATAIITIIACLISGFWSNTPIAMSVGMGLNVYFAYGLVQGMHMPWQSALGIVFMSGVLFAVLSFTKFRTWIMISIPLDLRRAISAGIGAFIACLGLKQLHIIVPNHDTLVALGNLGDKNVLLGLFGIALAFIFYSYRLKGAFILSIALTAILAWALGANMPKEYFSLPNSIAPIFMKLDIKSVLTLSLFPVIVTFFITDLFDTLGTLTGVGARAGIFQGDKKDDKLMKRTLEADAVATIASSIVGVCATTPFVESASGIEQGGRTGLTAVFTALFFVFTLFMLPLFESIPEVAIYPVLVVVGVLMFVELGKISFKRSDLATSAACFFIVLLMPFTFSITNGVAAGFIVYSLIRLAKGEFKELNLGVILLTIISLMIFIL